MADMSAAEIAKELARSPEVQQGSHAIALEIAERATQAADGLVGDQHREAPYFGTDSVMTPVGARAHVWAANGAAIHAERKGAVLVAASADVGIKRKTERDKPTGKMSGRSGGGK